MCVERDQWRQVQPGRAIVYLYAIDYRSPGKIGLRTGPLWHFLCMALVLVSLIEETAARGLKIPLWASCCEYN